MNMIILFILLTMFGPPVLLFVIALSKQKEKPDTAKILYILAAVYLIIGLGICGSMIYNINL